jgi:hypothetical protein
LSHIASSVGLADGVGDPDGVSLKTAGDGSRGWGPGSLEHAAVAITVSSAIDVAIRRYLINQS